MRIRDWSSDVCSSDLSAPAYAAIRTTTLAVKNMTCVTCGPIVKKSLSRVPGVTAVEVSTEGHTATITYDDAKTSTKALIAATTNAGYPSDRKSTRLNSSH